MSFKLWRQCGAGAITSQDYVIGAHHDCNGRFFATKYIEVTVDKATLIKANARELISETFKNETGWNSVHLTCDGAGGGGFTAPTKPEPSPEFAKFEGGFSFRDNSAKAGRKTCARKGKALVWFNSPSKKNIHYSLDCGGLGNFSGVLQPQKIGSSKYRAAKLIDFTIDKTIQAGCTLRTVAPGAARNHAFKSRTFECRVAAGHGVGGVVSPTRPTHDGARPVGPKIVVDPRHPKVKTAPVPPRRVGGATVKTAPVRTNGRRAAAEARRKAAAEARRKAAAERRRAAEAAAWKRLTEARRRATIERRCTDQTRQRNARAR